MNVDQLCVPFKQENLMLNSSGLKSIELQTVLKDFISMLRGFIRSFSYPPWMGALRQKAKDDQ